MRVATQSVTLVAATPQAEHVIERAARKCYLLDTTGSGDFLRMLARRGHWGPFEQSSMILDIVTDIGVGRELTRHRVGMSFCQESTRYCDYSKERLGGSLTFVKPPGLNGEDILWELSCRAAEDGYFDLRGLGIAPEIARSVLPLCLKTEIQAAGTLRAWMHFLELRLAAGAHPQMRELAGMVLARLREVAPLCAQIVEEKP